MKGKGLFMGNKWLDCTISPGQFTGEFAVQGELFDNTGFSLFATKEDLKFEGKPASDKPVSGFIKITPLNLPGIIGSRSTLIVLLSSRL